MELERIRKAKQLRSVDIAAKLGISQGYYSNLERGKRPFNETLLKKTSKILAISEEELRKAANSKLSDTYKLKSWMSNIKINGLPLLRAYKYYLETNELEQILNDDVLLKKHLKEFIEKNIGFSILAELSENRDLLNHLKERIGLETLNRKQKK